MTFEEMQAIVQDILRSQRALQESQLRLSEQQTAISEQQSAISERQDRFMEQLEAEQQERVDKEKAFDRRFEQLIGYSINRERDSINIQEDLRDLQRRVTALENEREQP